MLTTCNITVNVFLKVIIILIRHEGGSKIYLQLSILLSQSKAANVENITKKVRWATDFILTYKQTANTKCKTR